MSMQYQHTNEPLRPSFRENMQQLRRLIYTIQTSSKDESTSEGPFFFKESHQQQIKQRLACFLGNENKKIAISYCEQHLANSGYLVREHSQYFGSNKHHHVVRSQWCRPKAILISSSGNKEEVLEEIYPRTSVFLSCGSFENFVKFSKEHPTKHITTLYLQCPNFDKSFLLAEVFPHLVNLELIDCHLKKSNQFFLENLPSLHTLRLSDSRIDFHLGLLGNDSMKNLEIFGFTGGPWKKNKTLFIDNISSLDKIYIDSNTIQSADVGPGMNNLREIHFRKQVVHSKELRYQHPAYSDTSFENPKVRYGKHKKRKTKKVLKKKEKSCHRKRGRK